MIEGSPGGPGPRGGIAAASPPAPAWTARWTARELQLVRRLRGMPRSPLAQAGVKLVNRLADGWVYLLVALAVVLRLRMDAPRVILAAGLSAGVSHLIYPLMKRRFRRLRPFELDPTIPPLARVLDRYSFPSGHCMTVTAVLLPIVAAVPAWWPLAAGGLLLVALCRMIAAHHYPSDVVVGVALGVAVAAPVTWLVQQA